MKKVILSVMVALLLLSITIPTNAGWEGEITMWDYPTWRVDGDNYAWQKEIIQEFEKTHPGVTIKLVEIPWSGGPEKLDVAVQTNSYPDIVRGPLRVQYIQQGVIEPMNNYLTEEDWQDYLPNAIAGYSIDGKLYGFPFYMTSMTMMLNLDIFKARGVEPPEDGFWSWEEFIAAVQKMTYDSDGDGKIDTYGYAASAMPPNEHLWPFLYTEGARILNEEGKFGFLSEGALTALANLQSVTTSAEMSMPFASGYGDPDIFMMFKNGKIAIVPIGAWAVPAVKEDVPDITIGTAYYPIGSSGQAYNAGAISAYYLFKQKNEEKLKVLVEFARMLTRTEEQQKVFNYGTFPTRLSAKGVYQDDPAMRLIENGLDQVVFVPAHPQIDKMIDEVSRQIQLILLGRLTPEDGMKDSERKVIRLMTRTK